MALGAMRVWDAITDPIMGRFSDNFKGSAGRRKPFMFIGAILLTFVFPLLWWASPQWNDNAIIAYMIAGLLILYLLYYLLSSL